MSAQSTTLESLIESLKDAKMETESLLRCLGSKKLSAGHVSLEPPFREAELRKETIGDFTRFRMTIQLADKSKALPSILGDLRQWTEGPLLPDTGRCPLSRFWSWAGKDIKVNCSIVVESCDELRKQKANTEIVCIIHNMKDG